MGAAFHPRLALPSGGWQQPQCLLTVSMDRTMLLWEPTPEEPPAVDVATSAASQEGATESKGAESEEGGWGDVRAALGLSPALEGEEEEEEEVGGGSSSFSSSSGSGVWLPVVPPLPALVFLSSVYAL